MVWGRVLRARLFGLLHKQQVEAEMEEELRFHLAMRAEENVTRGMSEQDAWREARQRLGNVTRIKEEWRDLRGGGALEIFWHDLRIAARVLKKQRMLTATAVVALALGIGANTAIFTVLSSVLLRPLPYPDPDELMRIWSGHRGDPEARFKVSFPYYLDLRARNRTFAALGAFGSGTFLLTDKNGPPTQVPSMMVTSEIFQMLGARPAIGRIFSGRDDAAGNRAVIISEKLWEERFARAANIIDAHLTIEGEQYAIIGVMPQGFRFPVQNVDAQLWTTFARYHEPSPRDPAGYASRRDARYLQLLGRLKPGGRTAEAESDLNAIAAHLATSYAEAYSYFDSFVVTPWLAELTRKVRPALVMLSAAAASLLCVACANVATLLFARGATRQKEIAIRVALGAGRGRIARQLLTESLLLALSGGAAGLLLAFAGTRLLVALLPPDFPRADEIMPDGSVLAFAIIITIATSAISGLAPAWRSARCDVGPALKDGSGAPGARHDSVRLRNGFIAAQIVVSVLLLACACSLLANLWRLKNTPVGFDPQDVITVAIIGPSGMQSDESSHASAYFAELLKQIRQLPGVTSASAVSRLPAIMRELPADFRIAGRDLAQRERPRAQLRIVFPAYFHTMGIALTEGRDFDERDTQDATAGVIISDTLARRIFPNENALGQRIIFPLGDDAREREIIGIVGDVKADRLRVEEPRQLYLPYPPGGRLGLTLLIRSEDRRAAAPVLASARRIAEELNPNVVFFEPSTVEEHLDLVLAQPRLNTALLVVFAIIAVVLTAIGVSSTVAYSVAQRRHEIGIRLAFGASKSAVLRLILREAAPGILVAIVIGSFCSAVALSRVDLFLHQSLGSALSITALVALLVSGVAFIACCLPALRAANGDPLRAIGLR